MSQKKNTEGKVLPTKVAPPTTIKCTKTQRELFATKRNAYNDDLKIIIDIFNKVSSERLGIIVDNFIEELKIDIVNENWQFDANAMQFTKTTKTEKK